jgi:hypothetical protein
MLMRQKIILAFLSLAESPLSSTALANLPFLFRHEAESGKEVAFYDFVPHKIGLSLLHSTMS